MEGDSEEEGVAVLMAMGFEEQASREAIGMTGGEVEEAVALLLGGGRGGGGGGCRTAEATGETSFTL